jgi:hypothetical protein
MAGPVPAIHVFAPKKQDVDARQKAGHDERDFVRGVISSGGKSAKTQTQLWITS